MALWDLKVTYTEELICTPSRSLWRDFDYWVIRTRAYDGAVTLHFVKPGRRLAQAVAKLYTYNTVLWPQDMPKGIKKSKPWKPLSLEQKEAIH